jgi:TatD DNase family protein
MLINTHCHSLTHSGLEIINWYGELPTSIYSYGFLDCLQTNELNEAFIAHKNCLAIGEIGLDKTFQTPINKQIESFKIQLNLAKKHNLPVILHCVKAWNEVQQIKRETCTGTPWIFHGFRKTNLIESVLNEGLYLSIGTALIKDLKLQECVKEIPLEKIFLETDSATNFTIQDVYETIALLKNVSLQEVESIIFENFNKIFTKWDIGSNEQNY